MWKNSCKIIYKIFSFIYAQGVRHGQLSGFLICNYVLIKVYYKWAILSAMYFKFIRIQQVYYTEAILSAMYIKILVNSLHFY